MSADFAERVVIINGGTSGIGRAAGELFAQRGARVLVTGRRAEDVEETAAVSEGIEGLVADASNPEDAPHTVAKAVELWGRVDVVVNNAAAIFVMPLAEADAERIATTFATNVTGASLLAREALPYLEASGGSIVNVSSAAGRKTAPGVSHYAASKAALEHLTRCWAVELAPRGIRVNTVAPGPTDTGAFVRQGAASAEGEKAIRQQELSETPLGRLGEPEDPARWIVELADPTADWLTGALLAVDGGFSIT
ncbi:MAG: SDR family oxidoreductase [Solirubrobacteraceae bacterium MAG38_C4-C5]|nr:SDR family oxidoreductase [Candidatus Siliceabacter maunaloa]